MALILKAEVSTDGVLTCSLEGEAGLLVRLAARARTGECVTVSDLAPHLPEPARRTLPLEFLEQRSILGDKRVPKWLVRQAEPQQIAEAFVQAWGATLKKRLAGGQATARLDIMNGGDETDLEKGLEGVDLKLPSVLLLGGKAFRLGPDGPEEGLEALALKVREAGETQKRGLLALSKGAAEAQQKEFDRRLEELNKKLVKASAMPLLSEADVKKGTLAYVNGEGNIVIITPLDYWPRYLYPKVGPTSGQRYHPKTSPLLIPEDISKDLRRKVFLRLVLRRWEKKFIIDEQVVAISPFGDPLTSYHTGKDRICFGGMTQITVFEDGPDLLENVYKLRDELEGLLSVVNAASRMNEDPPLHPNIEELEASAQKLAKTVKAATPTKKAPTPGAGETPRAGLRNHFPDRNPPMRDALLAMDDVAQKRPKPPAPVWDLEEIAEKGRA